MAGADRCARSGSRGLATRLNDAMLVSSHRDFNQLAFWAVVVISYVRVPAGVRHQVRVPRTRARLRRARHAACSPHVRVYLVLFAIACAADRRGVVRPSFQESTRSSIPPRATRSGRTCTCGGCSTGASSSRSSSSSAASCCTASHRASAGPRSSRWRAVQHAPLRQADARGARRDRRRHRARHA